MQETKFLLKAEKFKEKLGKQDFHYDMEEVFEPVTAKQSEATETTKFFSNNNMGHWPANPRVCTSNTRPNESNTKIE